MIQCCFRWLCALIFKTCRMLLHSFLNVSIYVDPVHWLPAEHACFLNVHLGACSCSRICFCNRKGIVMHLPFIATPSIIACSCLISQYLSTPGSTASLVTHHPLIVYLCSICILCSSSVVFCMSSMDVHMGISTDVLMLCVLIFMHDIYWSQLPMWLWHDSQPPIYSSVPGLIKIHTLYWFICSMMYCIHCNNVATSLLDMAITSLWSLIMNISFVMQ